MTTFCPATMCPMFAKDGSPWTGEVNTPCERAECGWWHGGRCEGSLGALSQVGEARVGLPVLQLAGGYSPRVAKPAEYECPRAGECQWQVEASPGLCPPREALKNGIDPRVCAY